jgi:putative peptidoglycan lipid II flippase
VSGLLKNNLVVATGTALSRITGLLRVVALGAVLGRSSLTDAYKLANETPNIVYELLLGGVLSATLVPLFSTFLEDDDEESTNVVITTTVVVLAALTVVAVVAAPLVFRLYSFTVADGTDADLFRSVGTTLSRIFLIQIFFYGLTGLANAYLNSRRRFFAAAWSPIAANLVIIATLLSLPSAGPGNEWSLLDVVESTRVRLTLGLGATVGIALMALLLIPAVTNAGLRFRPRFDFRHPAVRRLLALSFWTVGFVLANQIALVVIRNLTQPGSGDSSSYFDAFTIFMLPHGLLAVSIATTFQPDLARSVVRKDKAAVIRTTSLGIRLTGLITIPAGVGIFVLRRPIVGFVFRGKYTDADSLVTSRALAGFALGLGAFSIYLFVLRAFYAHKDTKTAFTVNVLENTINVVFAFILAGSFGVLGLGASYAIAYVIAAIFVLYVLANKLHGFPLADVYRSLAKMGVAAALMGEAVWLVARQVGSNVGLGALGRVSLSALVGIAVYSGVLVLIGSPEIDALRARLARRSTVAAD